MDQKKKLFYFRLSIQVLFLITVSYIAFSHQMKGGGPFGAANIHSICPFGGLETLYKYIASGTFIRKIHESSIVVLVGTVLLLVFLGRYFCGWICVLGTLQELSTKLYRKIFKNKKRFTLNVKIDRPLRYLKYVILIVVLFLTWKTGKLVIDKYDPFAAYAHIPAGFSELMGEYIVGISILIGSLIISMFIDRFFCKYICPFGAFLGILTKISLFKIKRSKETCIDCGLCDQACPVNIPVSKIEHVSTSECINCQECVVACPTDKNTLYSKVFNKILKPVLIAIIGVLIYTGTIAVANLIGYWKTLPSSVEDAVGGNPNNIRGWMTLNQVSGQFNVTLESIYNKLNITPEQVPPNTQVKKIDGLLEKQGIEFDHDAVRDAVREILNIKIPCLKPDSGTFFLTGKMTIMDVAKKINMTDKQVIEKLGLPADISIDKPLRDLGEEHGFKVYELREILQKP